MFKGHNFHIKVLLMSMCLLPFFAQASGAGPLPSFSQVAGYESIHENIDSLSMWAQGEYAEHEGEGLFDTHPNDGAVIKATLVLVEELKQQAERAKVRGEIDKANALLLSAEATARYAAQMPHLLEKRITVEE